MSRANGASEQDEALIIDQVNGRQLAVLCLELIGPELKQRPTRALVAGFCSWIRQQLLPRQPQALAEMERISLRAAGRAVADDVWQLYKDQLEAAETSETFVEELASRAGLLTPDLESLAHRAERQPIARLGATVIEYGTDYRGKCYDEVPRERLDYYLRKAEENVASLRAYLTHPELESRRRGFDK